MQNEGERAREKLGKIQTFSHSASSRVPFAPFFVCIAVFSQGALIIFHSSMY